MKEGEDDGGDHISLSLNIPRPIPWATRKGQGTYFSNEPTVLKGDSLSLKILRMMMSFISPSLSPLHYWPRQMGEVDKQYFRFPASPHHLHLPQRVPPTTPRPFVTEALLHQDSRPKSSSASIAGHQDAHEEHRGCNSPWTRHRATLQPTLEEDEND